MRGSRGSTLLEFALAWPVFLLGVFGAVELSIWSVEVMAVRSAALAGARAASAAGAGPEAGAGVALITLQPFLAGATAAAWCPGDLSPRPPVWVCARRLDGAVEVQVGGEVPSLVPMFGRAGLPVGADVILSLESFS